MSGHDAPAHCVCVALTGDQGHFVPLEQPLQLVPDLCGSHQPIVVQEHLATPLLVLPFLDEGVVNIQQRQQVSFKY